MRLERRSPVPTITHEILGARQFQGAIHSGQRGVSLCKMAQVLAGIEAEPQSILTTITA